MLRSISLVLLFSLNCFSQKLQILSQKKNKKLTYGSIYLHGKTGAVFLKVPLRNKKSSNLLNYILQEYKSKCLGITFSFVYKPGVVYGKYLDISLLEKVIKSNKILLPEIKTLSAREDNLDSKYSITIHHKNISKSILTFYQLSLFEKQGNKLIENPTTIQQIGFSPLHKETPVKYFFQNKRTVYVCLYNHITKKKYIKKVVINKKVEIILGTENVD